MLTIRAMSDGKGYSSEHLENNDYYSEKERVIGHWQGRGAELLGLEGEVQSKDFEALRQSCHPETGEFLRQRESADRVSLDGTTQSHGRHLYDFTFSAPKSVSVMASLGEDKRLVNAHHNAVNDALHELESHAATRVRRDGAQDDRTTGNLAIAVYHHDTSRKLDPQLHTHAVVPNLTYDGTEGRWKALQASGIYERRSYLTEVYRNSLACQVRRLGYEIESHHNERGCDCGFEIRGIPQELLDKYSQRSQQRNEAIDRFKEVNGRNPSDNEVAVLVRESRDDKLTEISTNEVQAFQRERLDPKEERLLEDLYSKSQESPLGMESARQSLLYAEEHLFERLSVCHDHEVLTEALRHGRGRISHEDLRAYLTLQESEGTILRDQSEIATTESLARERGTIDCINRGIGRFNRLGGDDRFTVSDRLNLEQKHVVEFVLNSRDRTVNISGAAGTGKTATLQELHRGLSEAGRETLAIAPTVSAVEELRKVGFDNTTTLERLLQDPNTQADMNGKVLILDEAGMVSSRQMSELLWLAEEKSSRIVFSGDTRQIQSVEAGDALRVLEKESGLKSVSLTHVQRQTVKSYREAIQDLRKNPERGFDKLESLGAVQEVNGSERAQAVAQTYLSSQREGKDTLVVCATHNEIDQVNNEIRSSLKHAGELGNSIRLERDIPQNWTTAQKSEMRNFESGQVLGFHRAVKGIAKNETVEVIRVENKRLIVRDQHGRTHSITSRQAKSFDVLNRKTIEVAPGDRLLLTANHREKGFRSTNGEIVTVSHLDRNGSIHLKDGRTIPHDFSKFDYGYAVTAHRSQGKSVDSVIISADGMKKEHFYVAASRGRKSVQILTGDKQRLKESISRSSARQSASELARRSAPIVRPGIRRGLDAARNMARRAVQYVHTKIRKQSPPPPERPIEHKPAIREEIERDYDYGPSR
jgi:conjugative relaxase-like TrwC/TraI family protein